MANKKFSEFVLKTNTSGVSHIVGYSGAENVQITPANFVTTGGTGVFLPLAGGTMTGALVVDSTATVNDILTAGLGLALTGGTVGSGKLVLASSNKVHLSGGSAGLVLQNTGGTKSLTIDNTLSTFVGLVSGITPVDAANFVTKAYADGLTPGTGVFLPLAGGTMLGNIIHNDNVRSIYGGSGNDLQIYHDGNDSYISDTGTGFLLIRASSALLIQGANGESMIEAVENGAVNLYYNNAKKFETTSTGISVTGNGAFTNTSSGTETDTISLRNSATTQNTATALKFFPTTSTTRFASIVAKNVTGNNSISLDFLTAAGSTPTVALSLDATQNATFAGEVAIRSDQGASNTAILRLRGSNTTNRITRLQFEDYSGSLADGLIQLRVPTSGVAASAILELGVNLATLTLDASQNATFAGNIVVPNGKFLQLQRSSGSLITDAIGIPAGTDSVRFLTTGVFDFINGGLTNLLQIANNGNLTSSGNILALLNANTTNQISVENQSSGNIASARFLAKSDSGNIQMKAVSTTNVTYGVGDVGVINCDTMSGGFKISHNDVVKYTLAFNGENSWTGGGAFGGNLSVAKTTPQLILDGRGSGNSGATVQFLGWANTNKNWQLGNAIAGVGFQFRASATAGGVDFATVATINQGTGVYVATSDVNRKKDFENSEIGLKEVMELQPKLYRMKTESKNTDKHLGFIAQEVKEIIPQAYVEQGEDDEKFIGLTEMPIIAALVKSIQELKAEIELLKK